MRCVVCQKKAELTDWLCLYCRRALNKVLLWRDLDESQLVEWACRRLRRILQRQGKRDLKDRLYPTI